MSKNIDEIHKAKFWKPNTKEELIFYKGHFNRFEFDKHAHEEYTITLVQDGNMKAFLNGFSYSFDESSILTLNPDDVHACKTDKDEGYKYSSIYFKKSFLEKLFEEENLKNIYFSKSTLYDVELYKKLASLVLKDEQCKLSQIEFECQFIEILKIIVNKNTNLNTYNNTNQNNDILIKRAKDFINDNFNSDLTLDDIAKELDISKYHFLRLFKEKTHLSPHSYLMQRRIEKAKQSLQRGKSIITTAYECGFTDQSHLHRRFKSSTGLTPKNYQKFFN